MDLNKIYKYNICLNCGKNGHSLKQCSEPIISYGVILIQNKHDENYINNIKNDNINLNIFSQNKNKKIDDKIKFLMIMRKHSLGYIEFIRGKYNPDDFDRIISIFQQMTVDEINKINTMSFENLWKDFWNYDENINFITTEYTKSKNKFDKLLNLSELKIPFYVKNTKILWEHAEWGFPKGRRNKFESDKECAIREFEEESGFTKNDYVLLDNFEPIIEDLVGTNNIKYRHIYYIAISNNDKNPCIDKNNKTQTSEIGNIKYLNYEEAMNVIRPYHKQRKNIIEILCYYFSENL